MSAKARFGAVLAALELPPSLAGATEAFRGSWLLRRLSEASPGVEKALFSAREALFSSAPLEGLLPGGFTGRCAFELSGPSPGRIAEALEAAGLDLLPSLPRPSGFEVEVELPEPYASRGLDALREWLRASSLGFVESREGEARLLAVCARDARKRQLLEARVYEGPRLRARLRLGPKARLPGWLDRLGPRAAAAARVGVLDWELESES